MKGIIFDLDGVICFTDRYHYMAWGKAVEPLGVTFNESVNDRLRGVSRMESLDILLENYTGELSPEEKAAVCTYKNILYKGYLTQMSPADVSPEVLQTLGQLRAQGIKLAIGSSSKNTPMILSRLEITDLFDAVADGNIISRSKPDPEVFLKAAELLGLSPGECLVVEDAESGVDAGIAGGFRVAGLGPASKYPKTTYPMNRFSDILHYV